jgi:hypothetical protein
VDDPCQRFIWDPEQQDTSFMRNTLEIVKDAAQVDRFAALPLWNLGK